MQQNCKDQNKYKEAITINGEVVARRHNPAVQKNIKIEDELLERTFTEARNMVMAVKKEPKNYTNKENHFISTMETYKEMEGRHLIDDLHQLSGSYDKLIHGGERIIDKLEQIENQPS